MCDKLEMVEGHWYWTKSGHRAIVLLGDDAAWYGTVVEGQHRLDGKWNDSGVDEFDDHYSLIARHGPEMPTTATRPEPEWVWVPWDESEDLVGLAIRRKDEPTCRGVIVAQEDGLLMVGQRFIITYEELLQDWTHHLGGDDIQCGRQVDRSVKQRARLFGSLLP